MYLLKFRATRMLITLSVLIPASTACSRMTLRSIKPAPIRRTKDTATCATINALRSEPRPADMVRPPSWIADDKLTRPGSAGIAPTSIPVSMATPTVNNRTGPFSEISCARVVNSPARRTSKSMLIAASASPTTAPATASSVLSVRS